MKKIQSCILSSIVLLMLAVVPQSCKKNDKEDDDAKITNSYSYDGKVTSVNYAAKSYLEEDNAYVFVLSASKTALDNGELFFLHYSDNKFGVECNLNNSGDIEYVPSGTYYDETGTLLFYATSKAVGDRGDDITTATGNWVKVTKNGTSGNNFTIEFQMTLNGKLLKGSYKGDITNEYFN